jgi:hypothetical protein
MHRFFFDTAVDDTVTRDAEGIEYADLASAIKDARLSASRLLSEAASIKSIVCTVTIRDCAGITMRIITAELRDEGEFPVTAEGTGS